MKSLGSFSALLMVVFLSNSAAIAASPEDENAAAGCLACGGGLLFLMIGLVVLNIVLLVWVARDARARGMDNSVVWMILVLVTGVLGLIIYFFSRPKGDLVVCSRCGNKRLQASARCPHCQNS